MPAADPTKPLAPLSPETIAHLNATLGPPTLSFIGISGGRDIRTAAWLIGFGRVEAGGTPPRATEVEIRLTEGGNLVTTSRRRGVDVLSQTGRVNDTPDSAYRWLLDDGKGKLGPASKQAWVQACRAVPEMAGLEFEDVD